MERYLTAGSPIMNNFTYADGRQTFGRLGGSVIYALYGIAMCGVDPIFAQTVGHDFESFFGQWMDDNKFTREGLHYSEEDTTYLEVFYHPNGLWEHRPVKKPDGTFYNQEFSKTKAEDLAPFMQSCKGLFLNANVTKDFWDEVIAYKNKAGIPLLWEIGTQDFVPELREQVFDLMKKCEYYSMNLEEARVLFDTQSEEEILRKLADLAVPCFFRAGEKGAYIVRHDKITFVHSVGVEGSVDPTGCGNSSTAASMVCMCEGYDDAYSVALCNAVASINARFVGPCPKVTDELKAEAREMAEKLQKDAVVTVIPR